LNIVYEHDKIGLALKISVKTAVGIVEVAAAGFGAEWEARMLLKID
jgi:hypothetical protein